MKKILNIAGVVLLSGLVSFAIVNYYGGETVVVEREVVKPTGSFVSNIPNLPEGATDFTAAAELTVHAVVHVTTESISQQGNDPFYQFFYGRPMPPQAVRSSGSGVIISPDGYIVTNNHVVDGAENIEVALNDRTFFTAEVIGQDPTTDLALLKIDGENLTYIEYGNSDETKVGEWVLAVGNPFNLTSTVTAGIVSAKGRNINILGADPRTGGSAIESFIQTDAAVNPGNSGGALVNTDGELVGINSAIQSSTGAFVGYSFAIPSNIVKKVVDDMKEFGTVQRAYIGVNIKDLDKKLAKELGTEDLNGVYVIGTFEKGAAAEAGIQKGDVITKVGSVSVAKVPELQEQISQFRPGDEVVITLKRDGKEIEKKMVLKNIEGSTELIKKEEREIYDILGANLDNPSSETSRKLGLKGGVQVSRIWSGKLMKAGVQEGFIITSVDKREVKDKESFVKYLETKKKGEGVLIVGIYPNGKTRYYGFGM